MQASNPEDTVQQSTGEFNGNSWNIYPNPVRVCPTCGKCPTCGQIGYYIPMSQIVPNTTWMGGQHGASNCN